MRQRSPLLGFLSLSLGVLLLISCGGGGGTGITIEIVPNGTISLDQGGVIDFMAILGADTTNAGVTWTLTGTGCAGTGCGTLTNPKPLSVTYTAPGGLSAAISATLTAKSVAQPSKTQTQTIAVVLAPTFTTTTLPNGANGNPYNQTIVVSGGVTPYTYRITAGSLPPGLTINATTGQILGSPSAPTAGQPPATSNFIVTLTDSGGATPIFEPLAITVTPPPTLTVTTTALPTGTTNVSYAASILTQGGLAPLTFSVVGGGNFPVPGLTLNPTTGQVTGVPTAAGTYMIPIKVTDSSLPAPGQSFPATITLVVQAPAPLLITTPSLPGGTTAAAYAGGSLQATGGVAPYTWSLVQGQLPSGLTLSSLVNGTGSISGVPVLAGTSTFTVQVQDSEVVPVKTTGVFSITITPGTGNDALLSGAYSFLFNGFDSGGSVALAGTITTDGNGNVTTGLEDSNRTAGVLTGITLIGTYSIGSDGRGTLELIGTDPRNPQSTVTTDYQLVLSSAGVGFAGRPPMIQFFENNSTATSTDTFGTHGEGTLKPLVGSAFSAASFSGNYVFGFTGEDFNGKPAALAGVFNADGVQTLSSGTSDLNDAGAASSQSLSGNFTFAAGNVGGAKLVFQPPSKSQTTLTFNFYFVSANDLFFIEVDAPGTPFPMPPRLSGEMVLQSPQAVFGPSTVLPGPTVATGTGTDGAKANIFAGLLPATTCNGQTAFVLPYDQNDGGTVTSPAPLAGTCSATPNGRVAFNWTGAGTPRFAAAYLSAPGLGFLIGADAAVTSGHLELQSGGPFANSSTEGGYTLSALYPAETNVNNLLGQLSGNGTGSVPGIVDEFTAPTVALPEGKANLAQALATNINSLAANGRGTLTTNSPIGFPTNAIFYMVSPKSWRWMSTDPSPDPQIISLDH